MSFAKVFRKKAAARQFFNRLRQLLVSIYEIFTFPKGN